MTYPLGIDISSWQTSSDGKQKPDFSVINRKCDFIAMRAGISWGYVDKWFASYWEQTEIPRMAYHVVYPGENAIRQMDHFLGIVRPTEHDRLVLDMELAHGQTKARITQTLLGCLEYILENTGRYPVIYSRADWINQHVYVSQLPTNLDWWLAGYLNPLPYPLYTREATPPPALPVGVSSWLIHQTAERGNGKEHGVASHYVDIDRWNGTVAELKAYFGLAEEVPAPPPEIPAPPVVEKPLYEAIVKDIKPDRLNVRNKPNGKIIGKLHTGEKVEVWQEQSGWSRIGVERWVMGKYLQKLAEAPEPLPPAEPQPPVEDDWTGLLKVKLWSQNDPRWANDRMGSSDALMKHQGCLVTATAIYMDYLGVDIDPKRYNNLLGSKGGYRYNVVNGVKYANMYWQYPGVLFPDKIERELSDYRWYWNGKGWEERARSILQSNRPVLALVDLYEGGSLDQHWVVIVGYRTEDGWWAVDPETGTLINLSKYDNKVYRIVAYRRKS